MFCKGILRSYYFQLNIGLNILCTLLCKQIILNLFRTRIIWYQWLWKWLILKLFWTYYEKFKKSALQKMNYLRLMIIRFKNGGTVHLALGNKLYFKLIRQGNMTCNVKQVRPWIQLLCLCPYVMTSEYKNSLHLK